jgi:hypothetical protein
MAGKKVFPFVSLVDVEPNVNSEFLLIDWLLLRNVSYKWNYFSKKKSRYVSLILKTSWKIIIQ